MIPVSRGCQSPSGEHRTHAEQGQSFYRVCGHRWSGNDGRLTSVPLCIRSSLYSPWTGVYIRLPLSRKRAQFARLGNGVLVHNFQVVVFAESIARRGRLKSVVDLELGGHNAIDPNLRACQDFNALRLQPVVYLELIQLRRTGIASMFNGSN